MFVVKLLSYWFWFCVFCFAVCSFYARLSIKKMTKNSESVETVTISSENTPTSDIEWKAFVLSVIVFMGFSRLSLSLPYLECSSETVNIHLNVCLYATHTCIQMYMLDHMCASTYVRSYIRNR